MLVILKKTYLVKSFDWREMGTILAVKSKIADISEVPKQRYVVLPNHAVVLIHVIVDTQ